MEDFAAAIADEDFDTACAHLTSEARAELLKARALIGREGSGCGEALKAVLSLTDESFRDEVENYEVYSVTVRGDRATVKDSDIGDDKSDSRLRRKRGRWLIEAD
jgi:hypothetical protein